MPTATTRLPSHVEYPILAIGDLHGRIEWLDALLTKLRGLPEWPEAKLVFLGDYVDRYPRVRELVSRLVELMAEKPGSSAVMGNHDLAFIRATGLDGEPDPYWVKRYGTAYDHNPTFESYLGRTPEYFSEADWRKDLADLRFVIPEDHRLFFCSLQWGVEAAGHVFLHNGLSSELEEPADIQWELVKRRRWHGHVHPRTGTVSSIHYQATYPVWLGADKKLSDHPLPLAGKIQVSGHVLVEAPDANAVRIRIDTTGGIREPLTACLLRGPGAEPEYIFSDR